MRTRQRPILHILVFVFFTTVVFGCGEKEATPNVSDSMKTAQAPDTLTIFYTCDTRGHVDPCNCSAGMAGGISRRMTFFTERTPGAHLLVDAGDITSGPREWELLELEYILKSYELMGYHAVNIGHREIGIDAAGLANLNDSFPAFVSANVADDSGNLIFSPYRVVTLTGGYRVALIGIAADSLLPDEIGAGVRVLPPREAIAKYLPEAETKSDLVVLLAFADEAAMKALADEFFEIDVIVGGKVAQPSGEAVEHNRSIIVYNTDKGKSVGRLELALVDGDKAVVSNEVTMLLEDVADHPEVAALVEQFKVEQVERNFQDYRKDDEEGLTAL